MVDDKLEQDDLQRTANYEAIKSEVKAEVGGEIAAEARRGRVVARVSQVIDYIFFLIYALLAIRLLLALFAARPSAGFVQFIRTLTDRSTPHFAESSAVSSRPRDLRFHFPSSSPSSCTFCSIWRLMDFCGSSFTEKLRFDDSPSAQVFGYN